MNTLLQGFLERYYQVRLWFQGARFFEGDLPEDAERLYDQDIRLHDGKVLRIHIYGTYCLDIILKRQKLGAEIFRSYIVEAVADTEQYPCLRKFVRRFYYFNGRLNHFPKSDAESIILIAKIYTEYVKAVLEKS